MQTLFSEESENAECSVLTTALHGLGPVLSPCGVDLTAGMVFPYAGWDVFSESGLQPTYPK